MTSDGCVDADARARRPVSVAARIPAPARRRGPALVGGTVLVLAALAVVPAVAQDGAMFARGDAVVTGFSGTTPADAAGPDSDEVFIDPDGASAKILKFEPGAPPTGQLVAAPSVLEIKARDVGQVFAIGLDDSLLPDPAQGTPNIYLGATSAFGLQIVLPDSDGDGRPERVKKGQPNAQWMAGQFGLDKGGGPGSIYKVDGRTGTVSLFATVPGNRGSGLGDIAFDTASLHFFVSDLDTGLIHRIDSAGNLIDTFDHGLAGRAAAGLPPVADDGKTADIKSAAFDSLDPVTWGFTQPERRVWGLGLRAGRLYYAVAAGPEISSVSINLDGSFGKDPRREIEVSGTPNNHPISDIAFDNADYMYVAQRGGIKGSYDYSVFADSKQSVVFRFKREIPDDPATPGIWVPIPDEYAVGFPPDHRNTSGGLALGYGYDEAGKLVRGRCDAFVWSTGDSLRESAEHAAVLAPDGAAIVHGLHGVERSLIRPDNEPPFKSYFADYDGRFDDPQKQGHVGDVEIWQACDRSADFGFYTPLPYVPPGYVPPTYVPPGETPPAWGFNLRLDKEAVPGACVAGGLGFLCDYVVRVTNTGPGVYVGPIVVNDKLPAAPAGALMTFANQPPWLCLAMSPTEHQCTTDPAVLWPGDSVDLHVTVDLPVAAPVCHLDNAAGLVWPLGFGDANPADDFDLATATIPAAHCPPPAGEKTNLKIEKFAWTPVCKDEFGHYVCEYLVVVRNTGPGNYAGAIKVDEIVPTGTTATFSAGPKWTCAAAAPYSCVRDPDILAPNGTRSFGVIVKVPKNLAAPLTCKATNKAKIAEAAGGTDQNTDPTDDEAEATALLPGQIAECPGLPPLSNLKIEKTRAAGIECPVAGGHWVCEFKLKITNFFNTYTSPIQIIDALPFGTPAGTTVAFQAPGGWNCGGPLLFPNLYQCGSNNPNLKHLESVEIPVAVKIPLGPVAQCWIKNTAQIVKAPGGTPLNFNAGDDTSSASMKFKKDVLLPNGQLVCVSPAMGEPEPPLTTPPGGRETNLAITKTAGPSHATPTGQTTAFTITVTNTGPGVYTGPIEVRDTLFDGATVEPSNGSWSAPWTCEGQSAAGHPEQGICTHPEVELDAGESVVLTLEIEAPNSYVAPSGSDVRCGYKNKVEILKAAGGSPQNTNAGDDTAFAEVKFEPFEKHGQMFCGLGLTTPPPSCPQGWSHTPVPGKCCPPRTGWDGERCKRGTTPPEEDCPAGYAGTPPNCRKIGGPESCKITARCMNGRVWSREACACVCPPGSPWNPALWRCGGIVVDPPRCTDGKVWIGGACQCPRDTSWVDGKCRTPPSEPPKTCGPNEIGAYPNCRCAPGFTGTPPNCKRIDACKPKTCGRGETWDREACRCVDKKTCPDGTRGTYPDCKRIECPEGYTGTPPNCKRKACPAGTIGTYPNCREVRCPRGFTGTPPNCKRVVEPPKRCPRGFTGTPPNCKRIGSDPPKRCGKGFAGTPPNCRPIITRRPCPKGMIGFQPNCRPVKTGRIKKLSDAIKLPSARRPLLLRRK